MSALHTLDHKTCMGCGEAKPLGDYYANKGGLAGRQSRCKPCFIRQVKSTPHYPARKAARDAVRVAVRSGRLVRSPTCLACGAVAYTHGHHDDYERRLDVRWLCKSCHEETHRGQSYKPRTVTA